MKNLHQHALQHIQQKDWDAAHLLVQEYSDPLSCQIHGYLHRIEGDMGNAQYWYQRAGLAMPDNTLDEELDRLFTALSDVPE